jgi:hypothetical protein
VPLLCALALVAVPAAVAGSATPIVSSQPRLAAMLPPELQVLEQKMGQLQINSEHYVQTLSTVIRVTIGAKHGRPRAHTKRSSSKFSGEVSLSAAEGELTGADGQPKDIVIGSTAYLRIAAIARHDGGRPWVRMKDGNAALLFPDRGGSFPSLEVNAGGTGSYAQLIDLLATAVGPVDDIGPATVSGQQTTEFAATVEPLKLIKALSPKESAFLDAHQLRQKLDLFITQSGLPVRVVTSEEEHHRGNYSSSLVTTEITAVEVPVVVNAPPAKETISQAQFEKLTRRISGSHITIKFAG